jgi:hypothetical protein
MKYLLDSEGNNITIPAEVYLFKGIVSFLDFRIRGEYSTDFKVPNDSETREAIGYYSLNQKNKVTQKVFALYEDGNKLSDGRLFIRSVDQDFDLFFVAGNTNWINQITGSIKDLDFSEYNVTFNAIEVDALKTATEGVVFPVVDWAYNYKKLSNNFLVKPILGVSIDSFYDFYPCFYHHTIFKAIFDIYGIKISGSLISDPIFKSMALTTASIISNAYVSNISVDNQENMSVEGASNSQLFDEFATEKVIMDQGSALFDNANDRLVFTYSSTGVIFECTFNDAVAFNGTMYLYRNGVQIDSQSTPGSPVKVLTKRFESDVTNGDYFELYYRQGSVTGSGKRYDSISMVAYVGNIINNDGTVYISSILPDIKQIDFVKYIANRFNCLFDFDELSQTLTISKIDSIQITDANDLSDSLIGYSINPASGFGERNYLRTAEAAELINYKQNNLSFGDQVIESDGEADQDIIRTPLMPCETAQNFNLQWLISNIPLIRLEDSGEGVDYQSVSDNGGNARFNHTDATFLTDQVIRLDGDYKGFIVIENINATQIDPYATVEYTGAGSGKMYPQKIVFNNAGSREVIIINVDVNDINTGSQIYGTQNIRITDDSGQYPQSNIAWAYFTKPDIVTDLDNFKVGLNYGGVVGSNSITFGSLYHKTLTKIVKGQKLQASFLLSQVQYKTLELNKYIYLRTKDFEGYFLIQNIQGFLNQFTPVEMELVYGG